MNRWIVLALGLVASGCYTTTIRSGRPPGDVSFVADDKWHSGFLSGTQEASGPYAMDELCPHGWATIETRTSFANGLVEHAAFHIYNPQTVKVTCAAEEQAAR